MSSLQVEDLSRELFINEREARRARVRQIISERGLPKLPVPFEVSIRNVAS